MIRPANSPSSRIRRCSTDSSPRPATRRLIAGDGARHRPLGRFACHAAGNGPRASSTSRMANHSVTMSINLAIEVGGRGAAIRVAGRRWFAAESAIAAAHDEQFAERNRSRGDSGQLEERRFADVRLNGKCTLRRETTSGVSDRRTQTSASASGLLIAANRLRFGRRSRDAESRRARFRRSLRLPRGIAASSVTIGRRENPGIARKPSRSPARRIFSSDSGLIPAPNIWPK